MPKCRVIWGPFLTGFACQTSSEYPRFATVTDQSINRKDPEMNDAMSLAERADALEHKMMRELDAIIVKSRLFSLADGDTSIPNGSVLLAQNPGKHMLMGDDPRLPKMPERPTLMDFFKYRFGPANHLLQSARHAVRAGMDEKIVMSCLVHDIGVIGFIRADHGYWGAQMVAPYVDEEVAWAIRAHQALRFYPDESVGYCYPESYIRISVPTIGRIPISRMSTDAPAITNGT